MYWCWKKIPILINEFNLYSPKFGKISILYLLCANLCPSKMNTFEVWLNVAVQGQSIKGVTWNSDILLGWKLSHPKLGLKWYFLWSTCNLNWIEFNEFWRIKSIIRFSSMISLFDISSVIECLSSSLFFLVTTCQQ